MERIKAVVFDIGATLVEGPPVAPAKLIAGYLGINDHRVISNIIMCNDFADSDELCRFIEQKLGMVLSDETAEKINELWQSQFSGCSELNNSGEVLRFVSAMGIKLAVISDIWRPYYESAKKAVPEIERLVSAGKLSFRTGHKKPGAENFVSLINDMELAPSQLLMVGDTYSHDIEPAIKLGMKTVWLLRRPEKELPEILDILNDKRQKPDHAISDIHKLKEIIPMYT